MGIDTFKKGVQLICPKDQVLKPNYIWVQVFVSNSLFIIFMRNGWDVGWMVFDCVFRVECHQVNECWPIADITKMKRLCLCMHACLLGVVCFHRGHFKERDECLLSNCFCTVHSLQYDLYRNSTYITCQIPQHAPRGRMNGFTTQAWKNVDW